MGRDFTPYERWLSNKQTGCDLWLQNIVLNYNGHSRPMFTEEEQIIRHRFRNLAVAMGDSFLKLYNELPEDKRDKFMERLETEQKTLQQAAEKGEMWNCSVPETMKKWFVGSLDPGFYYAETNDELFLAYLLEDKNA